MDESRKRQGLTNAQRAAVRHQARSAVPKPTQKILAEWFEEAYGQTIRQSQISEILSSKWDYLDHDAEAASSNTQKRKIGRYPELEEALMDRIGQMEQQGLNVTPDMMLDTINELWETLDCYRGQEVPPFSYGWLDGFRRRNGLSKRRYKAKKHKDGDDAAAAAHAEGNFWAPNPIPAEPVQHAPNPIPFEPPFSSFNNVTTASYAAHGLQNPQGQSTPASRRQAPHSQTPRASATKQTTAPLPRPAARQPPFPYNPRPAYAASPDSAFHILRPLYARIASSAYSPGARVTTNSYHLAPRSGIAFEVPKKHIFRISTPDGPQVGDLNIWNLYNPRERFWASRTRQLHASHISLYDRLWSNLPYLRPLATIVSDTLAGYGKDMNGARCHDLLGTRCDPYVRKLLAGGDDFDYTCHSNLVRAILPYGLNEQDVHDVLNVFQVTGLTRDKGKYFMGPSPARGASGTSPPDYIEFFAETDLLVGLSACPGGDLSNWNSNDEAAMRAVCKPLAVDVFKLTDNTVDRVLEGWREPQTNAGGYKSLHGMGVPKGEPPQTVHENGDNDDEEEEEEEEEESDADAG